MDFAPTILEFAGVAEVPAGFDGESFRPHLDGSTPEADRPLYFELGYARGLRIGDWKYMAIRYPKAVAEMSLEERREVLTAWNKERRRKHLNTVTDDPARPFSHLTPIPGGGDAERVSTGSYPGYYDPDQLYHLGQDPEEHHNLAQDPAHAGKLAEMKRELQKILDTLPGDFAL